MTTTKTKAQGDKGGMCMIIGAAAGAVIVLPLIVGAFNSTSSNTTPVAPAAQSDVMILTLPQGGVLLPMPVPVPRP